MENKPRVGRWLAAIVTLIGFTALVHSKIGNFGSSAMLDIESSKDVCPSAKKIIPSSKDGFYDIEHFRTPEYKNYSLTALQSAVRVPTQTFDDMGPVGEDHRWNVMYAFEKYILNTFPAINATAELVHVNTHGLVFIINGSNDTLKPVLLTGHQDVVPVPEEVQFEWTYPPFSAYYDGDWIWGRGSSDCKNSVVAFLEATEQLLLQGYKPERTVILSLGFDEEIGGIQGAKPISQYLLERYGENGIAILIDEGGGITDIDGARYAVPDLAEKGYVDIRIDLFTSGGHSSIPPKHTGIGIMGEVITALEAEAYPLMLPEENPFFKQLQCEAQYSKMPLQKKEDILHMGWNPLAKKRVLKRLDSDIMTRFMVSTSQALDIFDGGLKINALPEKTSLGINHRVAIGSSNDAVRDKITRVVTKIAKKYGLDVQGFDVKTEATDLPNGYFDLVTTRDVLPSPVTPMYTAAWDLLTGTTRHVFEDFAIFPDAEEGIDPEVHIAPTIPTATTDTQHFWKVTENIYRYTAFRQSARLNLHTVDERVNMDAHLETVAWYYQFLRNVEEYGVELGL